MRHPVAFPALVTALALVAGAVVPAGTASGHGLDERRREVAEERSEVEEQIETAEASNQELEAELGRLESRLAERRAAARHARDEAVAANRAVDAVKADVERLRSRVAELRAVFDRRVADAYVHSSTRPLALIPEAEDSALDAFRRQSLATRVARTEETALDELRVAESDLVERQAELEEAQEAARLRLEAAEQAEAEVESVVARRRSVHQTLEARIAELRAEADALAAEEERLRELLSSRQAPRPDVDPVTLNPGGFIWPITGLVTSEYGPRWGRMHNGIDVDGNTGDAIRAAAPGVVISAGWRGGYGNAVVVDHGSGVATLYAHLSSIGVSDGQSVDQGAVVGAMGCTGSCTGSHLHFEVRVNGDPRNPRPYLP